MMVCLVAALHTLRDRSPWLISSLTPRSDRIGMSNAPDCPLIELRNTSWREKRERSLHKEIKSLHHQE